jgi:glycosyltransferase involved in cell wall biosynthesis
MQIENKTILMLIPSTLRGGVEEYTLTVATNALESGWEIHAAFPNVDGTQSLIQDLQASGVTYHPLDIAEQNTLNLPGPTRHLPRFFRTLRLLDRLKPDVVQITLPHPHACMGSILACAVMQIPAVVRFGLVPPDCRFFTAWRTQLYSWCRSRHQQWITISQNNRRLVCELLQIPEDEVICIYNGAKVKVQPHQNQATLRHQFLQELDLKSDAQLAITVGRLNYQKGYIDLIPALPDLVQEFPNLHFIWVGDGDQRPEIEQQLVQHAIQDRVHLLGYRSDVPQLLQAADLFVFPTRFEGGQSFALAEAMVCGLPIVSSDASGIPEVIQHHYHGLLFRTGDCHGAQAAIRWALTHPEAMQQMAQRAQIRASEFTEEKMIQNYLQVWQQMSQRSPLLSTASTLKAEEL